MPEGSCTSRLARFSNASVVWIACWNVRVAVGAQLLARLQDALQHGVHGQLVADRAGRGERHRGGVDARRERCRALRLGGVVETATAGGGVGAAGVGEHDAQGVQAAALAADEHRRGRGRAER